MLVYNSIKLLISFKILNMEFSGLLQSCTFFSFILKYILFFFLTYKYLINEAYMLDSVLIFAVFQFIFNIQNNENSSDININVYI